MQVYDKWEKKPRSITEYRHIPIGILSPYRGIRRIYTFEEHKEKVKQALESKKK